MQAKIWDPEQKVFQRGQFSASEVEVIREKHLDWKILAEPHLFPKDPQDQTCFDIGGRALVAFANYFSAVHIAQSINQSVRVISCFIDQGVEEGCNAMAFPFHDELKSKEPTYIIHVNIHSCPILMERVRKLTDVLDHKTAALLPGENIELSRDLCIFVATLLIFFHEMGHVVRGHLEWNPPVGGNCGNLSHEVQRVRRTLETDADAFAAHMLGTFLKGYSKRMPTGDGIEDQLSWFLCGLVGSYAMFSTLAENGSRPNSCYHSPIVRLHAIVTHLGMNMGLKKEHYNKLFEAFLAEMMNGSHQDKALLEELEFDTTTYVKDDDELRRITSPMLADLVKRGRLQGWLVTK